MIKLIAILIMAASATSARAFDLDPVDLIPKKCRSIGTAYSKEFYKQYSELLPVLKGMENESEMQTLIKNKLQYGSNLRVRMMDVCPEDLLYYLDDALARKTNKWGHLLLKSYKFHSGVEGKSPEQIFDELTQD